MISIDYRLAPEHPFPAPIDDGIASFRYIRDNAASFEADPRRIAVGGNSAGGAIAAVVCQSCRTAGETMPAFQMLIYPATDFQPAERIAQAIRRRLLPDQGADRLVLGGLCRRPAPISTDLRLSPLLAKDFTGLPPAFVLTAGFDPLRDEGRAYANRLIDAGVKTTYVNYPGTIHGFFSLTRFLQAGPQGQRRGRRGAGGALRDFSRCLTATRAAPARSRPGDRSLSA